MMETSQNTVSCYPVNSYASVAGSSVMKEFTSGRMKIRYEGHQSKEATEEFKILFICIVYKGNKAT